MSVETFDYIEHRQRQPIDNAIKWMVFFALAFGFLAWWLYLYPYLDFNAYFAFNGDPFLRHLAPYGIRGYGIIHIPTLTLMFAIAGSTLLAYPLASLVLRSIEWMYEKLDQLFTVPEDDNGDETDT